MYRLDILSQSVSGGFGCKNKNDLRVREEKSLSHVYEMYSVVRVVVVVVCCYELKYIICKNT